MTDGDEEHRPVPRHVPVMLERVLELLDPVARVPAAVVVDATLGLGGHAAALLARHPDVRLIGIDRDPEALRRADHRLAAHRDRITIVHAVYDTLPEVLDDLGIDRIDGVLFDLGVSSLQLDADDRGFAYSRDTLLDMRMDSTSGRTAADVVNTYSVVELSRVLREYGEERFARRIAQAIERERRSAPITSSARLAELVREAVPAATRRTGGHPAKRTFQALRIEVNDELGALDRALPAAVTALRVGGRAVVLAYQSLEDRLVKRCFAAGSATTAPVDMPVVPDSARPQLRLLTRGGETATDAEIEDNPRAASVRLRAVERVREAA
jgi:16S rRNA (cytosine1402-N4)-methyltransferase